VITVRIGVGAPPVRITTVFCGEGQVGFSIGGPASGHLIAHVEHVTGARTLRAELGQVGVFMGSQADGIDLPPDTVLDPPPERGGQAEIVLGYGRTGIIPAVTGSGDGILLLTQLDEATTVDAPIHGHESTPVACLLFEDLTSLEHVAQHVADLIEAMEDA
jgi:hypothetical protein